MPVLYGTVLSTRQATAWAFCSLRASLELAAFLPARQPKTAPTIRSSVAGVVMIVEPADDLAGCKEAGDRPA